GFMRYSWPGNVRELENACERIAQTCSCRTVRVCCMPAGALFHAGSEPVPAMGLPGMPDHERRLSSARAATDVPAIAAPAPAARTSTPTIGTAAAGDVAISLDERLKEVEANLITWALKMSGGNKSKAAELLHIKRSTLGDRINRCGLAHTAATEMTNLQH